MAYDVHIDPLVLAHASSRLQPGGDQSRLEETRELIHTLVELTAATADPDTPRRSVELTTPLPLLPWAQHVAAEPEVASLRIAARTPGDPFAGVPMQSFLIRIRMRGVLEVTSAGYTRQFWERPDEKSELLRPADSFDPVSWSYRQESRSGAGGWVRKEFCTWSFRRGGLDYELAAGRPLASGPWDAAAFQVVWPGDVVLTTDLRKLTIPRDRTTFALDLIPGGFGVRVNTTAQLEVERVADCETDQAAFDALVPALIEHPAGEVPGAHPDSRLPELIPADPEEPSQDE
jgi:hypothetical protein